VVSRNAANWGDGRGGIVVTGAEGLIMQVRLAGDGDAEELAELSGRLRAELLDFDVQAVERVPQSDVPEGAKGLPAVAGWLAVHLGGASLRDVLAAIADWVIRNNRSVEISSGGDVLKLSRATPEEQRKIIDAWLDKYAPGS
jgi:hypothetical protein